MTLALRAKALVGFLLASVFLGLAGCAGTAGSPGSVGTNQAGGSNPPSGAGSVPAAPAGLQAAAANAQVQSDVDSSKRCDFVSRQEGDHDRRPLHASRDAYRRELYGHRADERHDLFLCGVGGELGGRGRQFGGGQCQADSSCASSRGSDGSDGQRREWAGGFELGRKSPAATSYNVKRGTTTGGPYTKISSPDGHATSPTPGSRTARRTFTWCRR